jgi:ABC-type transport system involved in multi-copper enzyme maturation permease subunit
MTQLWWAQIRAVIRLEMKKTFFAKRGLWIYLLALMPVVLWIGHAIQTSYQREARVRLAAKNEKHLTPRDLAAVASGMTSQEVVQRLGMPSEVWSWNRRKQAGSNATVNVVYENRRYTDGESDLYVHLEDGKVTGVALSHGDNLGDDSVVFAAVFQFFFLRLAIFFGCLGIFMNLFRGELLDKSLHFYFLAPVRREVVLAGKYFAALLAATVIFASSEALQIAAFAWHFDPNVLNNYLYHGSGLTHFAAYLGVTLLACVGYGSLFLAAGLVFRNPIFPAAGILIWEAINPFLPTVLQKFSVIYYLKALCPVPIPVAPGTAPLLALFVSNPDPIASSVAILGVVFVSAAILFLSGFQVRRMQIDYTTE